MRDLWTFIGLFGRRRWLMLAGGLLSLTTVLAGIGLLTLAGWFITAAALAGLGLMTVNIFTPSAGIRFFALARTGSRYAERLVTHHATFALLADLRLWFFRKAIPLAPARLGSLRGGDLLNRATADIDALDNLYLRVLTPSVVALIVALLAALVLGAIDTRLAFGILALLAVAGIGLPALAGRLGHRAGADIVATTQRLRTDVVDGVQGLPELMVFQAAGRQADRVAAGGATLVDRQRRMSRIAGLSAALSGAAAQLAVVVALLVGVGLLQAGTISGPVLVLILLGVIALFEVVQPLPAAFQQFGRTRAAARRLLDIAEAAPAVAEPARPVPAPARTDLALDDVTFRYRPEDPPAVAGLGLAIPEGRRLALLGPSGAGKSTLTQLLLRFWDPQDGAIRLGGVDLRDLALDELWSRLGLLSQRSQLFDGTIRDNLLIADPDADDDALLAALTDARVADFVEGLPDGLDTWVGEAGVRVSGGQARRIALARVILKRPPVLILDEPTEGVDAETEREIMASLGRLMDGRTVVLITHRLDHLHLMDEIVLLEQGRIVERGSPAALAARPGRYARLLADHALEARDPVPA